MSGSIVRYPLSRVLVAGTATPATMISCTSNGYRSGDDFDASIPLTGSPITAAFWLAEVDTDTPIEIQIALPTGLLGAASWISVFYGKADKIEVDVSEQTVSISGRDLTTLLQDLLLSESFINQTTSQIATILAGRVGLQVSVPTTTARVGQYYEVDHTRNAAGQFSKNTNGWEMLCYLAEKEDLDVWVDRNTLRMAPKDGQAGPPSFTVQVSQPTVSGMSSTGLACNVDRLTITRNARLAKDIQVIVSTWNGRSKSAVVKKAGPDSAKQKHSFTMPPGTSPALALQAATARRAELSRHERLMDFDMPVDDLTLFGRSIVALAGTGTAADGIYHAMSVRRSLDSRGLVTRVHARNTMLEGDVASP